MGTTIRRQPVSFPIPASPDYKFLNITDFGGLNISSNPFVVSSNTASDCLNVYVDEDNALSTRPRLQPKYDLMNDLNDDYELVGVYALHDGYLLHVCYNPYKLENPTQYEMVIFTETENGLTSAWIRGAIPEQKCRVFEQNNDIYVLSGENYYVIKDKEMISPVSAYVPTLAIGKNKRVVTRADDGSEKIYYELDGSAYESLNLLTNKFKETFFWDGVSELQFDNSVDSVDNNYYKQTVELTSLNDAKIYNDNTGITVKNDKIYYFVLSKDLAEVAEYDLGITLNSTQINSIWYKDVVVFAPSDVNKKFAIMSTYKGSDNLPHKKITAYEIVSANNSVTKISEISDVSASDISDIELRVSENLKFIWVDTSGYYKLGVDNEYTKETITPPSDGDFEPDSFYINEYGDVGYYVTSYYKWDGVSYSAGSKVYEISSISSSTRMTLVYEDKSIDNLGTNMRLLPNGLGFYALNKAYFKDSGYVPVQVNITLKSGTKLHFSENGDYGWFVSGKDSMLHIIPNLKQINNHSSTYVSLEKDPVLYIPANIIVLAKQSEDYYELYSEISVHSFVKSSEPLITTTNTMTAIDERYAQWKKLSDIFKQALLFERFDNNTWFASKNYTFHTLYNDPTYIPLSSYNDLGEDFEEITGLSIVNDNVLAAYKRNRIYIITPATVGDQETYSYTETKNVVGNDVPDAPILTILTEMPTIVSYDGIFALNQLENVQSSDRITTLISENINPRWLKESAQDIDNCKTLNRLYWTYYILPHRRIGDENKDYTKIYLLDNRTQQWYYWELPIYVINAMVKDNKTHFIHEDGTVFTLEITDLIHEFNPDVTEYYDKVNDEKLIIPWRWTSQILSLSTINYSKKLVDTTFILTDTDTQDEYGLDYSFKAWRKSVSETNATTISNNIHYVQSTTKRTMIPRFNFIQIKLSNTEEDLDNNKLRLVGLGLKYVLLEGLY